MAKKKYRPKTVGIDYLYHSLASFNGNNHCIRLNPQTFYDTYVDYKAKMGDMEAVQLAAEYREPAIDWIGNLLDKPVKPVPAPKRDQWYIWEDLNGFLKRELDLVITEDGQKQFDRLLANATPADFKEAVRATKYKNLDTKEARYRYLYAVVRNKTQKLFE